MAAETPPAAPAAAEPAADPFDAAEARVVAREDAAAAAGKGPQGATGAAASSAPTTAGAGSADGPTAAGADKPRPRAGDIAAIARREWQAREAQQQARQVQERFKPLTESLGKKDLKGALEVLAKDHGVTFADFVNVLTEAQPAEKTPAQVAEETVAAKLAERDQAAAKAQQDAAQRDFELQQQRTREGFAAQAEAGTPEDPNRWELTHVAGVAGQAWDVIWGRWQATAKFDDKGNVIADGERLTREQALDYLETKLKEKQAARRTKQNPAPGTAAGNGRNEAAGTSANDGRAAGPSFTNRATSGMPAVVGAHAVDESSLSDFEAIDRAAARANITLR